MTFGPYGLGHVDGKTVMVANAVPGDVSEVNIVSERNDYALGETVRILRAGDSRRHPPCPFLPQCGGCDWQQLEYSAQVAIKAEIVAGEFRRAFGIELDPRTLIEPAPAEFGYRSRIRLKVGSDGSIGFFQAGSKRLVPIDRCMIAAPQLSPAAELARAIGRQCVEIEAIADSDRNILVAYLRKPPAAKEIERAGRVLANNPAGGGVVLRCGDARVTVGDVQIAVEVEDGVVIEADADMFSQVNRDQNRKLVAHVMNVAAIEEGTALLDLFCGSGNFSLPAARRGARVTGVDSDSLAIAAANDNARRMGFATSQFLAMKAVELARFLGRARYRPDVVIIDPPRIGAIDLMGVIVRLRPKRIVYVSCDPSTLVRDLQTVATGGYQIGRVRGFDFFPNTHHVEVVAQVLLT